MSKKTSRKRKAKVVTNEICDDGELNGVTIDGIIIKDAPITLSKEAKAITSPPKLNLPEAPSFIEGKEWSYNAEDIEEFRKKYEKFRNEYAEYKKAVAK